MAFLVAEAGGDGAWSSISMKAPIAGEKMQRWRSAGRPLVQKG